MASSSPPPSPLPARRGEMSSFGPMPLSERALLSPSLCTIDFDIPRYIPTYSGYEVPWVRVVPSVDKMHCQNALIVNSSLAKLDVRKLHFEFLKPREIRFCSVMCVKNPAERRPAAAPALPSAGAHHITGEDRPTGQSTGQGNIHI